MTTNIPVSCSMFFNVFSRLTYCAAAASLLVGCTDPDPESSPLGTVQQEASVGLDGHYVVLGLAGVHLKRDAHVSSGHIGVDTHGEALIGRGARVDPQSFIAAPQVRLKRDATTGRIYAIDAPTFGAGAMAAGSCTSEASYCLTEADFPLFDAKPTGPTPAPCEVTDPAREEVFVPRGESVTLAPGAYGTVIVRRGGTLTLPPSPVGATCVRELRVRRDAHLAFDSGVYHLGHLRTRAGVTTSFASDTDLVVTEGMRLGGHNAFNVPVGEAASPVARVFVYGPDMSRDGNRYAMVGAFSNLHANIVALDCASSTACGGGTVHLRHHTIGVGAFFGRDVIIGHDTHLQLDSALFPEGACGAADDDLDGDGLANRDDNCLTIANADQADSDADGVGDRCDNCVGAFNPLQRDDDADIEGNDGFGNACASGGAPFCGDGVVQGEGHPDADPNGAEACDLGAANGQPGSGCDARCRVDDDEVLSTVVDVCADYAAEIDALYPQGVHVSLQRSLGLEGHASCLRAVACAGDDRLGCVVNALDAAHQSLVAIDVLENDAVHVQLEAALAAAAVAAAERHGASVAVVDADSLALGQEALAVAQVDLATDATAEAITNAGHAFYWFEDARQEFAKLQPAGSECEILDRIIAEMTSYEAWPQAPAPANVASVRDRLQTVVDQTCEGPSGDEPCANVNLLVAFGDVADAMADLSDFTLDPTAARYSVWTRNWQRGLARAFQIRTSRHFQAVEAAAFAGLGHPDMDPQLLADFEAAWNDTQQLLDCDHDLSAFVAAVTAPAMKCDLHYLYEIVDAWWLDAQDPTCDSFPYALPVVCHLGTGTTNEWPLHGGTVVGD